MDNIRYRLRHISNVENPPSTKLTFNFRDHPLLLYNKLPMLMLNCCLSNILPDYILQSFYFQTQFVIAIWCMGRWASQRRTDEFCNNYFPE